MYLKSEEEISGVLQVLPGIFKEKFGQELDLAAVKTYLIEVLEKEKRQTLERQFAGWNVSSMLAMLKTIDNATKPKEQPKATKKTKKHEPVSN